MLRRLSRSRTTILTVLVVIVSILLAVGLFVAGAMWRARVTAAADKSAAAPYPPSQLPLRVPRG